MALWVYVHNDLNKLRARLAKQGVSDVTAMDYQSYQRSTLWHKIKEWVLRRDEDTCRICRAKRPSKLIDFDVHHRSYDLATMEGWDDSQLVTLCRRCHDKIERFSDGRRRRDLEAKDAEYHRLAQLHRDIVCEGMPVSIESAGRRGSLAWRINYGGRREFLEFYSLDGLLMEFALSFHFKKGSSFRVTLPTDRGRLRRASGLTIFDRATDKPAMRVYCSDESALIKLARGCAFDVKDYLAGIVADAQPWHVMPAI